LLRSLGCGVDGVECFAALGEQHFSGGAERHSSAGPFQEAHADASLEAADGARQGWLCHPEPLGGPPKVEFLGHRDEVREFSGFEAIHTATVSNDTEIVIAHLALSWSNRIVAIAAAMSRRRARAIDDHRDERESNQMSEEQKVREVLARYVRATDARDGVAQGSLFTDDAIVQICAKTGPESYEPVGAALIGGDGVRSAVEQFMAPHPELGSSHHVTADHLIAINGERAHLNAQFIVFEVRGDVRPAGGWPAGVFGAQGSVRPIESGYYDTELRLVDGEWKIVGHRVLMDLPVALPGA